MKAAIVLFWLLTFRFTDSTHNNIATRIFLCLSFNCILNANILRVTKTMQTSSCCIIYGHCKSILSGVILRYHLIWLSSWEPNRSRIIDFHPPPRCRSGRINILRSTFPRMMKVGISINFMMSIDFLCCSIEWMTAGEFCPVTNSLFTELNNTWCSELTRFTKPFN